MFRPQQFVRKFDRIQQFEIRSLERSIVQADPVDKDTRSHNHFRKSKGRPLRSGP